LLEPGDTIKIRAFEDLPPSTLWVSDVFEDAIAGYVTFEDDQASEFGELYEDMFHLIYAVEKKQ